MAEALKTKEQLEKEWWDAWWAEDYSWEGLATKDWAGWVVDLADLSIHEADAETVKAGPEGRFRAATLQDYWRDQEGDLIASPDGKQFTRVHVPLEWANGTPTGKFHWPDEALDAILTPKLLRGRETKVSTPFALPLGVDQRSQLQGCILLKACKQQGELNTQLNVRLQRTCFAKYADFHGQTFGPGLDLYEAHFADTARFTDTKFAGYVFCGSAYFGSLAWFEGAIFLDQAHFGSTRFFESADFRNATFHGKADFPGCFLSHGFFDQVTFSEIAWFEESTFGGHARFSKAIFVGSAEFGRVSFSGEADFSEAVFREVARFRSAEFAAATEFRGARFEREAQFRNATFTETAWFQNTTFVGNAWFDFATFHQDAWFTRPRGDTTQPAVFMSLASFGNAIFKAPARFGEAQFRSRISFDKTLFESIADFSEVGLPAREEDWRAAFDGALFQRSLDLRRVAAESISLVSGAVFDRGVLLERTDEVVDNKGHKSALRRALRAGERENALKALESGAISLKQAMNTANDVAREQRFYRLELRARRKQKGTSGTEKFFSLLYAGASKYGASIGWPFLWLAAVIVGFAALYLAIEGQLKAPEPRSVFESLRYSLSRVIPLGTWDESDDPLRVKLAEAPTAAGQGAAENAGVAERGCSFRERLMATDDCRPDLEGAWLEAYRLVLSALATFQTVIAAALYFLLALAVRRKFQIS